MSGEGEAAARRDGLALALVLLGVGFRLLVLGDARFTGDESYFWATARNIATFDAAPIYGPPLTGSEAYHPGPIFYYLMALPQRLGVSPWLGGAALAALHGLAAWLVYRLLAADGSAQARLAGRLALALWLFAPWDVLYGDRVWLSCAAPVWGTLLLHAAARVAEGPRWQAALVFLGLVCPQLHMSAPVVWASAGALVVLGPWPRWSWRALLVGVGLAVLAYGPPIYWELAHEFSNTRAILAQGGGKEGWDQLRLAPLRVFGYALLYGSADIAYHFGTGYWTRFDDVATYLSLAGWQRRMAGLEGRLWVGLGAASIAVAALGWGLALGGLAGRIRAAWGARDRAVLTPGDRVLVALGVGLLAAIALLVVAKKGYFPHYTNLLMPALLAPVALGLAALSGRGRSGRGLALGLVALSAVAMAGSTLRYYRQVDRLNGLDATRGMVARVLAEPGPYGLRFTGFYNLFAWQMLAQTEHRAPFAPVGHAPVQFVVHNHAPHEGPVPPGSELFGAVRLERRGPAR